MPAPLFIQYETKTGRRYLYDCGTGRILEVDETIYALVADYRKLSVREMLTKYRHLGRSKVSTALRELDELRKTGHMVDHVPTETSRIDRVLFDRELYGIGDFWTSHGILLILGITERCNLNCSYCCYSGKFAGQRTHGLRSMPWPVAQRAMTRFLENESAGDGTYPISFYGGEPLLEFHLLRECVHFAENDAASLGKKVRFTITTNGTLLDDATTDFLVEHDVLTLVSFDGPRQSHDRYRLFPDGTGSFDLVVRNLRRFAERHPNFKKRGFSITLAPPLHLAKTAAMVDEFYPDFPLIRTSLVNTGMEHRFDGREDGPTQYGCFSGGACSKKVDLNGEAFRSFAREDAEQLDRLWNECVESVAQVGIVQSLENRPFAMSLFGNQLELFHRRTVTAAPLEWVFFIPCIPGFTRRFVDVDGNYRVCERVDDSDAFRLGNVWDGPDVARLERTLEMRRHFGDCGNCNAIKTCDVCYARIPESDGVLRGFDPLFDVQCQHVRETRERLLRIYTEIMERNPNAFDRPLSPDATPVRELRFAAPDISKGKSAVMESVRENNPSI